MRISVQVVPRARRTRVERLDDTHLRVAVTAPPHEGLANAAVIEVLAAHFRVARACVRIVHGHRGRHKLVEIDGGMPPASRGTPSRPTP